MSEIGDRVRGIRLPFHILPLIAACCSLARPALADTHYVSLSGGHIAPYTNWVTAATNIQSAIDASSDGDMVLVSDGVYSTGGRVVHGAMTNRVVIDKAITVQSVNGPEVTMIKGAGPIGDSAVRCVYVVSNATLSGFTLANGATRASGDFFQERSGGGAWCESSGVLSNCVLTGNAATLFGGGSYKGTLNNSILIGNSAGNSGGGSYVGTLNNCVLSGNSANDGGGARGGTLNNCALTGNSATGSGGGSYEGTLNNCTLTGNSASGSGGGIGNGELYNCIVYFNAAPIGPNYQGGTFNYSCTTPAPGGTGNITNDPMLASASHLSAGSPCIGAGSTSNAVGTDIDGEAWQNPPSMGCDELITGSATGTLNVSVWASPTYVTVGGSVEFRAEILGPTTASVWDFGDGHVVSNQPYVAHAFATAGVHTVELTAYNDSNPSGVTGTVLIHVLTQAVHYVSISNATPVAPYTTWATAATDIQSAIDASSDGDMVLVNDGVYATGGRAVYGTMTNRVAIDKAVTVQSINGPAATTIMGAGPVGATAVRCAYVGTNATLTGFTLANGATHATGDEFYQQCAGGAWCEPSGVLNNCALIGNSANSYGGGSFDGTLNNCVLTGNSARDGGGSFSGTLNNCTLSGNSARNEGGGSFDGTLNNCIVYFNTAPAWSNYIYSTFNYSCTTPDPGGTGNITDDPMLASASHLAAGSPCIGAGSISNAVGTDIDGEAWQNPPSMGADELISGSATGALSVSAWASRTNVTVGIPIEFRAEISGRTTASDWDFGDGHVVSNQAYTTHTFETPGDYAVELTAYNDSHPLGVTEIVMVHIEAQTVHYVNINNATPLAPYTTWATAATNIQDAIDAATQEGALVLVSNGVYSTGGRAVYGAMTNRVVIDKYITVRSVNGPAVTTIEGAGPIGDSAVRCAYVGTNATLSGFTLANGATRTNGHFVLEQSGGGAWCESDGVLNNCVLSGNAANYVGGGSVYGTLNNCELTGNSTTSSGGGSYGSTLNNSVLTSNSAFYGGGSADNALNNCILTGNSAAYGGGSYYGTLNNCTLTGNSAGDAGGGSYGGTLNNCIVYFNAATTGTNYDGSDFAYSCTTPEPGGTGNITNDPQFVNVSASNFHLQATSPCINAGTNQAWMIGAVDLDGRPRILGGTVDMGAYEYTDDTDGDGMPDWWESMHGLNPAVSNAPGSNADGDWMTDLEEYWADTQPTNGLSYFPPLTVTNAVPGAMELVINPTSTARVYRIFMNTNLLAAPQAWVPYGSVQTGTGSELIFSVTNDLPQENYRAGVGLP